MKTFSQFCAERQAMWWGKKTDDPILASYRFTNIYRVLDRQSQFVLRHCIIDEPRDTLLRCLLHRTFLKDDTWDLLTTLCDGNITEATFNKSRVLAGLDGQPALFHRAYKFGHKGGVYQDSRTYVNRINMIQDMMDGQLSVDLSEAKCLEHMVAAFKRWPLHQDFTALQFSLDLNYAPWHCHPEDYAPLGPGSKRGLVLVGKWPTEWPDFRSLPNRQPSLIDTEHALCEYAKYVALHSKSNSKKYVPDGRKIEYIFPAAWGIGAIHA